MKFRASISQLTKLATNAKEAAQRASAAGFSGNARMLENIQADYAEAITVLQASAHATADAMELTAVAPYHNANAG